MNENAPRSIQMYQVSRLCLAEALIHSTPNSLNCILEGRDRLEPPKWIQKHFLRGFTYISTHPRLLLPCQLNVTIHIYPPSLYDQCRLEGVPAMSSLLHKYSCDNSVKFLDNLRRMTWTVCLLEEMIASSWMRKMPPDSAEC